MARGVERRGRAAVTGSAVVLVSRYYADAAIMRSRPPVPLLAGALLLAMPVRARTAATMPMIPGAALSVEDADMLDRMQLRGRERPDEVVVIGGHIDS